MWRKVKAGTLTPAFTSESTHNAFFLGIRRAPVAPGRRQSAKKRWRSERLVIESHSMYLFHDHPPAILADPARDEYPFGVILAHSDSDSDVQLFDHDSLLAFLAGFLLFGLKLQR
jgi:hypothetical protein